MRLQVGFKFNSVLRRVYRK